MTHHQHSSWRDDLAPLTLAAVGALVLTAAVLLLLATPTRFTDTAPVGPRLEVTGVYTAPRPTSVLPAPNAVIGDPCPGPAAVGVSAAGVVVCRAVGRELRWVLSP